MSPSNLPTERAVVPDDALAAALSEFADVVGPANVLVSEEAKQEFRDPFQPARWDGLSAAAVIQPDSVEQIQQLVRIASRHNVPLWTQSQGRNNGYGGAAPRLSGSVTVNLRRMNKILEINEELGYALVEPGVSFQQLYDEVQARGLRLMVSVPDLGWGSLVGNSLDHGTTYLPNGKDFMAPCGMEVVLADGDLLRTGMGAQPGNASWNLYRRSYGPSLDQLFMQSNFGIVTKMGVWLTPTVEKIMHVTVDVFAESDLVQLVDTLRRLRLDGTIDGVPCIFNTVVTASTLGPRSQWYDGDPGTPIPDAAIDEIAKRLDMGRWMLRFALYGDEPVVDHNFAKARAAFARIPGARVRGSKSSPEDGPNLPNPSDQVLAGVPNLAWAQMGGWYGGEHGGHMGFSPVVPLTGEKVYELHRFLRERVEAVGLDYAADIIVINARSAVSVAGLSFDYDDEEATRAAYEIARQLVRDAGEIGYSEYRAHLNFMDLSAEQFSFNNHAYLRFVERIKDAVDPAGILSPGKQGIWPRSLRKPR
ncbi:FAD-binding oxidoreductase [Streptomyces phaeolivaceus]|uniref:FAD-binding oxidoreductase n=1 Tax=Streptomyces phaeolivaceus TaxID=2653200 RepID=A0A5P8KF87_9ACTN|nr:FAD-binding oxidoreductase [Streptomyces phaeolivaceus]